MNRLLMILAAVILAAVPGLLPTEAQNRPKGEAHPIKLWAAISVSQPIFDVRQVEKLDISFAVTNDGDTTINPKVGSSHLFINGVEPKDWYLVIGNGPKPIDDLLPPGRSLQFGYVMGRYFEKPGIYTLRWQGENFRAREVTFRVLP
jgi:hypothetical protein